MISKFSRVNSRGIALIVVESIAILLAIVAICLRIWARRIKRSVLCFNDYAVLVALFFCSTLFANHIISVTIGGLGQHTSEITSESLVITLQLLPAAESVWACANTAVKLSILHFYKTIFSIPGFRRASYVMSAIVLALGVAIIIQSLAICRPFQYQWDTSIEGVCGNRNLGILMTAVFNLVTDLGILIMPMPLVWNLRLRTSKKVALTAIFGLGGFICIITILRIAFTVQLINHSTDPAYYILINAIWLTLEPALGIVNASLPLMQPIYPRLRSNLMYWTSKGTAKSDTMELHSKASADTRKFNRLEDSSINPVESTEATTTNEITAQPRSSPDHAAIPNSVLPFGKSGGTLHERVGSENVISVTSAWDITSTQRHS